MLHTRCSLTKKSARYTTDMASIPRPSPQSSTFTPIPMPANPRIACPFRLPHPISSASHADTIALHHAPQTLSTRRSTSHCFPRRHLPAQAHLEIHSNLRTPSSSSRVCFRASRRNISSPTRCDLVPCFQSSADPSSSFIRTTYLRSGPRMQMWCGPRRGEPPRSSTAERKPYGHALTKMATCAAHST